MKLILFDIDGTLLHGHGVGARAMERAGRSLHGPNFSLAGIDFGGALDPWIYAEAARKLGEMAVEAMHSRFHESYLVELARELLEGGLSPQALPGVHDALSQLGSHADVTLGLVTGNYTRAARLKLRAAGIDPEQFVVGAFGDDAPTRPELVRLALQRWAARGPAGGPEAAIVIGDTPRDIDCAQRNGCRCIAVATGWHSAEALREAGADLVLHDLSDLAPVLEFVGSPHPERP
jgi:phosphoglycolate phosphatase-like HAD superfamily hydrolase